jgi:hypothetical protein
MRIAVGLLLAFMGAGMAFFWLSYLAAGKLNRGWRTIDGEKLYSMAYNRRTADGNYMPDRRCGSGL